MRRSFIPVDYATNEGEFNPKSYVVKELTEVDVIQLKEVFDMFDHDENGLLTPVELRTALLRFGYQARKETIYSIISEYDGNEKGGLTFKEFLDCIVRGPPSEYETKEEIRKIYLKYDRKNKGYFTFEDLKSVALELGENLDDDSLHEMISACDSNKDGKVTFEDFRRAMQKNPKIL